MTMRDVYASTSDDREWERIITEVLVEEGREATPEAVRQRQAAIYADGREMVSTLRFDAGAFDDTVVVSAEDVAAYWSVLPDGTNMLDLVDVLVPPYERLFVEFQRQPNSRNVDLNAWGVLIEGARVEGEHLVGGEASPPTEVTADGWLLEASLVCEYRKGEPVGPLAKWLIPLDAEGRSMPGDTGGYGSMFMGELVFEQSGSQSEVPQEELFRFADQLGPPLLGPALFAISLMHCKNVDVRSVDPPERMSKSHARRKGRPLTRYYVLDIGPMRRILDREGEAQTRGLRHALHICRGHFKTYTPEAPLLGRHTGTYWWPAHARGAGEQGVVEKDYRIRLDHGLGREYVDADEHPEIQASAAEHTGRDPDLGGRGLRAHNRTQNLLAQAVRDAGYEPRRPKPDEPQYDLAWEANDVTWVAEIKSITPQNEERQLRTALGQVLRYRQLLGAGGRTLRAMIATEVGPSDASWIELCSGQQVALVWAPENLTVE